MVDVYKTKMPSLTTCTVCKRYYVYTQCNFLLSDGGSPSASNTINDGYCLAGTSALVYVSISVYIYVYMYSQKFGSLAIYMYLCDCQIIIRQAIPYQNVCADGMLNINL